ncbi:PhaM family polyhydroxyalkanoate granule multifunctional regulatory protein [Propionivibrio sp.]|uniref:PhaM family polyhydroxyalkanoate granule multifunctional regulatory protein n=1 Tax=Propionivibrio sp. TaxID=2212460 RepID=UPI003BF0ECB2
MSNSSASNDPLDFTRNLWGKMGFSLPGMVTPTFDVDELEKRLVDLKAVEGWLKMNLSMLQLTIQTLEMQCSTLNAVRQISNIKPDQVVAASLPFAKSPKAPDAKDSTVDPLQSAMWPWALMQQLQTQMQQQMQEAMEKQNSSSAKPNT